MKMNLENFRKIWTDFVLRGCMAFIVAMISAIGKSIAEEIRKNGGARDA